MSQLDLVLRGGRVVDPSQGIDSVADVGFQDGRVAEIGPNLSAAKVHDVSGLLVTPGLIDLHTHVYWGGTSLGVDPLRLARGGCTTLVDAGSAGPGNYPGFLEHIIRPSSPVSILAFLNVSFAGIYGFAKRVMVGESGDLRLMAPAEAVEVVNANRDTIVGVKVRVGLHASQYSGVIPLDIAATDRGRTRSADDGPYRSSSADARGRSGEAPAWRYSDPLFPPIPEQPRDR